MRWEFRICKGDLELVELWRNGVFDRYLFPEEVKEFTEELERRVHGIRETIH